MSGKYDIGDEFVLRIEMKDENKGRQFYTTNNGMLLTEGYFDKLEQLKEDPMTEADWWSDGWSEGYNSGLVDAWEAARKIVCIECDGGFNMSTLLDIFKENSTAAIMRDLTASEAIVKIRKYEEKKKAEAEIKVGDEIIFNKRKLIVTHTSNMYVMGLDNTGSMYCAPRDDAKKTGRHFPQIAEVLEQMKGE